jgi:hypothetical protein
MPSQGYLVQDYQPTINRTIKAITRAPVYRPATGVFRLINQRLNVLCKSEAGDEALFGCFGHHPTD